MRAAIGDAVMNPIDTDMKIKLAVLKWGLDGLQNAHTMMTTTDADLQFNASLDVGHKVGTVAQVAEGGYGLVMTGARVTVRVTNAIDNYAQAVRTGEGLRSTGWADTRYLDDGSWDAAPREFVSTRGKPVSGVLEDAVFAQVRSKPTKAFSEEGQKIYSQAAGRPIVTVEDLTQAINDKIIGPNQIPIDYVLIDGHMVIANTRSSTALLDAGVPKIEWFGRDRTGVKAYGDILYDDLVRQQLQRNYGGSVNKARR
jgi:hypothetical protein